MIKRKIFHSMITDAENGLSGIKKQDGYEISVDGEKFNVYEKDSHNICNDSPCKRVYILDPKNGLAVFIYEYSPKLSWNEQTDTIDWIELASTEFVERGAFEDWKAERDKESYVLANKIFAAYKRAESLREKLKEAIQKESK